MPKINIDDPEIQAMYRKNWNESDEQDQDYDEYIDDSPTEENIARIRRKTRYIINKKKILAQQRARYHAYYYIYHRNYRQTHKEKPQKNKDYVKAWRQKNKNYDKQYYYANKEKILASRKQRKQENKEKILASRKQWYQKNKAKILAYQRQWYQKQKELSCQQMN